MKKQLIQLLEFLLAKAHAMSSNAQKPPAGPTETSNKQLGSGQASAESFPDIALAGVWALPGTPESPLLVESKAADVEPPPHVDTLLWALNQARWRLARTEELLLNPSPDSIREVSLLVEEVGQQVLRIRHAFERRSGSMDVQPYSERISEFQQQMRRVSRLLEGAKRVQWARIRWIGALVQTYTPGGRARLWNPFPRQWTLEM